MADDSTNARCAKKALRRLAKPSNHAPILRLHSRSPSSQMTSAISDSGQTSPGEALGVIAVVLAVCIIPQNSWVVDGAAGGDDDSDTKSADVAAAAAPKDAAAVSLPPAREARVAVATAAHARAHHAVALPPLQLNSTTTAAHGSGQHATHGTTVPHSGRSAVAGVVPPLGHHNVAAGSSGSTHASEASAAAPHTVIHVAAAATTTTTSQSAARPATTPSAAPPPTTAS